MRPAWVAASQLLKLVRPTRGRDVVWSPRVVPVFIAPSTRTRPANASLSVMSIARRLMIISFGTVRRVTMCRPPCLDLVVSMLAPKISRVERRALARPAILSSLMTGVITCGRRSISGWPLVRVRTRTAICVVLDTGALTRSPAQGVTSLPAPIGGSLRTFSFPLTPIPEMGIAACIVPAWRHPCVRLARVLLVASPIFACLMLQWLLWPLLHRRLLNT